MGNGQHRSYEAAGSRPQSVTVRLVGGPTALLEIAGLRLLTDPTCDTLGFGFGAAQPLVADESRPIQAVLLSHHRHTDGLDGAGRRLFATVPMTLATATAADRLGRNATALPAWYHLTLDRPDGGWVKVTGVPVQYGPDGSEHVTARATGFTLTGADMPTVYLSEGNTSLEIFTAVVERFGPVDLAVLPVDATRTPTQDGYPMLTADQAAEAATRLDARRVVPLSHGGSQLLTQGADTLRAVFARCTMGDRLTVLGTGEHCIVRTEIPRIGLHVSASRPPPDDTYGADSTP
ncbi:MBL fold metallo-hydrolase [Streptomyces sp. NPDC001817]|uniref:MBL fold metallo-hydrolase n=1 Tax=Streptomyces sp. NPDC001817 TaxID=3154398 RepID=UPI0033251F6B